MIKIRFGRLSVQLEDRILNDKVNPLSDSIETFGSDSSSRSIEMPYFSKTKTTIWINIVSKMCIWQK